MLPIIIYGNYVDYLPAIEGGGMWAMLIVVWSIIGTIMYIILAVLGHELIGSPLTRFWNGPVSSTLSFILPKPKPDPQPSILAEYIRALHNRVCPQIDVVE